MMFEGRAFFTPGLACGAGAAASRQLPGTTSFAPGGVSASVSASLQLRADTPPGATVSRTMYERTVVPGALLSLPGRLQGSGNDPTGRGLTSPPRKLAPLCSTNFPAPPTPARPSRPQSRGTKRSPLQRQGCLRPRFAAAAPYLTLEPLPFERASERRQGKPWPPFFERRPVLLTKGEETRPCGSRRRYGGVASQR